MNRVDRLTVALAIVFGANRLPAQLSLKPSDHTFWLAAAATLTAAAISAASAYRFSLDHRSHTLDRWAEIGDGLARVVISSARWQQAGSSLA